MGFYNIDYRCNGAVFSGHVHKWVYNNRIRVRVESPGFTNHT